MLTLYLPIFGKPIRYSYSTGIGGHYRGVVFVSTSSRSTEKVKNRRLVRSKMGKIYLTSPYLNSRGQNIRKKVFAVKRLKIHPKTLINNVFRHMDTFWSLFGSWVLICKILPKVGPNPDPHISRMA